MIKPGVKQQIVITSNNVEVCFLFNVKNEY